MADKKRPPFFSVNKKQESPTPSLETAEPVLEAAKPPNVECPEHGVQRVTDLSVCPICGETPMGA